MQQQYHQFIETGEAEAAEVPPKTGSDSSKATPSQSNEVPERSDSDLRSELLASPEKEVTTRFTVDIPKSLNRRLEQLSLDSERPKTELIRRILRHTLDELGY